MQEADLLSDEQLVGLTLEGDRDAFGQIVARYQSPICALAYSACGSVTRSEDLAQEVFVAAWRKLRELKNPAKLKSWLYAIARHLISTTFRQQARNPLAAADPLDEVLDSRAEFGGPSDTAMSKEEEAILWHVLSGLPEVYREPMVLFYRQDESIASVAEILGISEEAVRQRLSRGRAMLNERVAKVVEIGLRRSGPTPAFALSVLAALPATGLKAGAVGATTATAKGWSAFAGSGVLSGIAAVGSAAACFVGGLIGLRGRIQSTRSSRERRFAVRTVWGLLAFGLGFVIVNRLLFAQHVLQLSTQLSDAIACSLFWLGYLAPLFFFSIWRGRQQRQIQIQEGTAENLPTGWMWRVDPALQGVRAAIYGMLACLFFGTCSWAADSALAAGDHLLLALLLAGCAAGWLLSAAAVMRRPERASSIFTAVWWGLGLTNLALVNLRWDAWFGRSAAPSSVGHGAPWAVNYLIVFFFATTWVGLCLRRIFMALPDARRAAGVAIAAYFALLLCGSALVALMR
jgi:RNA polymerase sigma factor (sigma-70 family)